MPEDWQNAGFGVYVHWPFCLSKCPYCDFNSHVQAEVDQSRWADALCREIEYQASLTPNRTVDTVFFGGGTPSLMHPDTVNHVIHAIRKAWNLSPTAEISLEANPTSVEACRFQGYGAAGVNRLSMGIQSLIDRDLKALGRMHTAKEARQAFDIAKGIFNNVSFDLIYARQNQTIAIWQTELQEAINMAVDHLSLYQLTIEPETRFGELYTKGRLQNLPRNSTAADMYDVTNTTCKAAGLLNYEVSNHARPGAECRHNLLYWRYGDYAGIGPGAHGRLSLLRGRMATESPLSPETWLQNVEKKGFAMQLSESLTPANQFEEYLMMSLRLYEGSDLARLQKLDKNRLDFELLRELEDLGYLKITNQTLSATDKGRIVLNSLLLEILSA